MSVFPAVRLEKVPCHSGSPQYHRYGGEGTGEVQHPLRGPMVLKNSGVLLRKNETKRGKKQPKEKYSRCNSPKSSNILSMSPNDNIPAHCRVGLKNPKQ